MHGLYTLAIVVLAVVLSPWFAYQAVRYRKYIGSLAQRMGYLPISFNLDGDESIWIHAVSVGEALTARAIIPELRERYPGLRIFVSTTTLTGQQVARTRLSDVDAVFFFPFDLPPFVRRAWSRQCWPPAFRSTSAGSAAGMPNGRRCPSFACSPLARCGR